MNELSFYIQNVGYVVYPVLDCYLYRQTGVVTLNYLLALSDERFMVLLHSSLFILWVFLTKASLSFSVSTLFELLNDVFFFAKKVYIEVV